MRFLIRKAVAESKLLWFSCALAVAVYCWLRVWLVAQLEMSAFQRIVLSFGDEFQKYSPVPLDQLFTYLGRVARSYSEPIVTVCLTAWATARGSDVVSGELSRGTLEMVLAQPVSRRQVIVSHFLVTTAGSLALCALIWAAIWVGIQTNQTTETVRKPLLSWGSMVTIPNPWGEEREIVTPMRQQLDATDLIPGSVNLFCLSVFIGAFAAWMSAWDRFRWRTIGIVIGFLILQSMLLFVALSLPEWSWLKWLTIFTLYNPELYIASGAEQTAGAWQWLQHDIDGQLQGLGGLGANALLLTLAGACYALADRTLGRRDLPSPL